MTKILIYAEQDWIRLTSKALTRLEKLTRPGVASSADIFNKFHVHLLNILTYFYQFEEGSE